MDKIQTVNKDLAIRLGQNIPVNSIRDIVVINHQIESISRLSKDGLADIIKDILITITDDIFKFYREHLDISEAEIIVKCILKKGYFITVPDINLFKQYACEGNYKNRVDTIEGKQITIKFYKLTPDVYLDWFECYIAERLNEFEDSNNEIHQVTKQAEKELPSEKTIDLLHGFSNKFNDKYTQPPPAPVNINIHEAIEVLAAITNPKKTND